MRGRAGGQLTGRGESRVDGHHLRVHAEAHVRASTSAPGAAFEGNKSSGAGRRRGAGHRQLTLVGLRPGRVGEGTRGDGQAAGLEGAAVEPRAVVVEALPNHLAALDNDAAVAIEEGRLSGLLEAEVQVLIGLHCGLVVLGVAQRVGSLESMELWKWAEKESIRLMRILRCSRVLIWAI